MPRWLKLLLALIPGCKTASQIVYKHRPTSDLVASWNIDAPALAPFTRGGVVYAPRLYALSHTETAVALVVASRAQAEVVIESATLSGAGPGSPLALAGTPKLPIADAEAGGVWSGTYRMATVPNADLEALAAGGDLTLTLVFPEGSGDPREMTFTIELVEQTWLVTP